MRWIARRSLVLLTFVALLAHCSGTSPFRVPAPVADEFVSRFGVDGLGVEVVGDELIAEVRDTRAAPASESDRRTRAREMAQWLWDHHGRTSSARRVSIVFLALTDPRTVIGEYQFNDLR